MDFRGKIWAGVSLAVVALLLFTHGPSAYLVSRDATALTGAFTVNGAYVSTVFEDREDAGEAAFGSWSGSDANAGSFASGGFAAPAVLNFCVSGYPHKDGISLYLENTADRRKLTLAVRVDPAETWKRFEWTLPLEWRGQPVRVVADDQSRELGGWIGITLPRSGGVRGPLPRLAQAGTDAGVMAAEAILFLLPGLALAMLIHRRFPLDGLRFAAVTFTAAGVVGYLGFWSYFASITAGKVISFAVLTAVLAIRPKEKVWRESATCFLLILLTAWFYLGAGYLYKAGDDPGSQAADRVTMWQLPPDHLLPWVLADHIYREVPLRPHLLSVWKSSDRPPLQAGIVLMQRPMWGALALWKHYHLLGIFLQSLWVGALWIFLRFAGIGRRRILTILALCIFSGFFFVNSFYVWPKLLAAAFFLIALTFSSFTRPDFVWTRFDAVLAGTALALSLLSHTGVILVAPGVAWVLYRRHGLPGRRAAIWGAAAVLILWIPWMVYQKVYDPPGDLLLKEHLAGSMDENHSFGQLMKEAYGKLSVGEWVRSKWENVQVLFVPPSFLGLFGDDVRERYDTFSRSIFFSLFQALGILNLGLLARLVWRRSAVGLETGLADRCVIANLISTGVWCLVMFYPGSTVVHQGSLAAVLMLFAALGIYLAALAPRLAWAALAIQALAIFPIFLFGKPLFGNPPGALVEGTLDAGYGVVALLALGGLATWAWMVDEGGITAGPRRRDRAHNGKERRANREDRRSRRNAGGGYPAPSKPGV